MSALPPRVAASRLLSRRLLSALGTLQDNVRTLRGERDVALQRFVASRFAATHSAQREFWLEFSWADQEYRIAVRRLARFCAGCSDPEVDGS